MLGGFIHFDFTFFRVELCCVDPPNFSPRQHHTLLSQSHLQTHPPLLLTLTLKSFIVKMVYKWNVESERKLLLLIISEMSAPSTSIWPIVAQKLDDSLNANACRYHRAVACFVLCHFYACI